MALLRRLDLLLALPWIGLIWLYQRGISPFLPGACRFEPSCSRYADEALRTLGFSRGFPLLLWRLVRCQPLCKGGWDPVPTSGCHCRRRTPPPTRNTE